MKHNALDDISFNHLESLGTKAYSIKEAKNLFKDFKAVTIETSLSHGDLLTSQAGQRHAGVALNIDRIIWPRWLLRLFFSKYGLSMRITAKK